jgi:hypothetical protein
VERCAKSDFRAQPERGAASHVPRKSLLRVLRVCVFCGESDVVC